MFKPIHLFKKFLFYDIKLFRCIQTSVSLFIFIYFSSFVCRFTATGFCFAWKYFIKLKIMPAFILKWLHNFFCLQTYFSHFESWRVSYYFGYYYDNNQLAEQQTCACDLYISHTEVIVAVIKYLVSIWGDSEERMSSRSPLISEVPLSSKFVHFWPGSSCPVCSFVWMGGAHITVHLLFLIAWTRSGCYATQVLLLPPWRTNFSIAMCCLSKLCFWVGLSHCWLATALATCIVALCKSSHTGTETWGGGILSSGAGIENGGRPINESLP